MGALRECRTLMVQTEEQYFFVYHCIVDALAAVMDKAQRSLGASWFVLRVRARVTC